MIRTKLIVLLAGAATLAGCNKQPSQQSAADYYRDHPEVPNPRGGSFKMSKPGTYEYVTPTDTASGAANSTTGLKP
uniref:hypothetical protein n=1 Tax=uncultured Sphingomonas sp. TaxID=158754 RepID=UPI0035CC2AE8